MTKGESIACEAGRRSHQYDDLSHALETAEYYQKQKVRGADRKERHETLQHLTTVVRKTLVREGKDSSHAVQTRVREALRLTRGA